MVEKIISGGQTGVESAALRLGLRNGIPIGGTVPAGFVRDGGVVPAVYHEYLAEADTASRARVVGANVRAAGAVLVLERSQPSGDTSFVRGLLADEMRPSGLFYLEDQGVTASLTEWLIVLSGRCVLFVTGPSERSSPGIAQEAYDLLEAALLPAVVTQAQPLEELQRSAARRAVELLDCLRSVTPIVARGGLASTEAALLDRIGACQDMRLLALLATAGPDRLADSFARFDPELGSVIAGMAVGLRHNAGVRQQTLF